MTLSIWPSVASAVVSAHVVSGSVASPDVCFSSPLLAAQVHMTTAWQCNPKPTGDNATTTPSTGPDSASADESNSTDSSSSSSGGWSGPYACAGPYCVYSHDTFAAGRGIVIISEGDSANALANLPIMVELARLSSESSEEMLRSANINIQTQGIVTKDIPGKGRGFVATRPIHRGEQIMAYTPALIMQRGFLEDGDGQVISRADQLRMLRDAVGRLSQATRVVFWKQLGQTHQPGDDDILDVIMNNSFNLPLTAGDSGGGGAFIGNFPEVSMYNHDCRPSVAFHLDGGVIHRTQAVKSVTTTGEELSISYVDSFRARSVRRGRTRRNWGFECACAHCRLPEALANASDHRLWRIYEVENAMALFDERKGGRGQGEGGSSKERVAAENEDIVDRIELLLSLYAQERLLESHGASAYRTASLNYNGLKRRAMAIKYALLALESSVLEQGPQSEGVQEMVALLANPERHWSWGRRVDQL